MVDTELLTTTSYGGRRGSGLFRVSGIGDSITAGDYSNLPAGLASGFPFRQKWIGDAPLVYANIAAKGAWDLVTNPGIGGQTSTAILARLENDIIAMNPKPDICVIGSFSWNDISQGVTPDQQIANLIEMVRLLRAAGITPIIGSPTPEQRTIVSTPMSTAQRLVAVAARRQKQIDWCEQNGVLCVDFYSVLVDETGKIKTEYDRDGTVHPNPAGYKAMGVELQKVIERLIPPRPNSLLQYPTSGATASDMLGGIGFFSTDVAGVGTGWSGNLPSGASASCVTDSQVKGRMQRMSGTNLAATWYLNSPALTGWAVGDWLEISALMTTNHTSTIGQIRMDVAGGPSNDYPLIRPTLATRDYVRLRWQVPAGTTSLSLRLQLSQDLVSSFPVSGSFDVGQLSIRNLTALGLGN